MNRSRVIGGLLATLAPALLATSAVAATPRPSVTFTQAMSGANLMAGCAWPDSIGNADDVGEPDLSVNPRDGRNVVGVWLQGGEGGGFGVVAGASFDGGHTWRRTLLPVTRCEPNADADSTADASVSFGADGAVYATALRESPAGPPVEAVITRSLDGGRTWSAPFVVDGGPGRSPEGPRVTADPRVAGRAYVVWYENPTVVGPASSIELAQIDWPAAAGAAPLVGPARVVQPSDPVAPVGQPILRVLPDGSLLAAYLQTEAAGQDAEHATRSTDGGRTWSAPSTIGITSPRFATDPDGPNAQLGLDDLPAGAAQGDDIASYPAPSLDVGPDGAAYVAYQDITSPDGSSFTSTIWVARSTAESGWSTWTSLPAKSEATQAFMPTLAVAPDGTVGVTYYDLRDDTPGAPVLFDHWFAESHDRGATWQEVRVMGPYEEVGDKGEHFGLDAIPGGFGAAFTSTPSETSGHEITFARLRSG
jgi:hypothetical protein